MTGHRKRGGKPLGPIASMQRRQQFHRDRLQAATTPDQQLAAALNYFRSVLSHTGTEAAAEAAQEMVQMLWSRADQLAEVNAKAEAEALRRRSEATRQPDPIRL